MVNATKIDNDLLPKNMMRGKNIFEPPRFMSTQQAAKQLMEIVKFRRMICIHTYCVRFVNDDIVTS